MKTLHPEVEYTGHQPRRAVRVGVRTDLESSYDELYTCFIFMMTLTYAMTVGAVLILRRTQPDRPRPYRCFGYPWLPIIYLVVASGFVLSTLFTKPFESLEGLGSACLGVPLYFYWRRQKSV